MIAEVQSNRGLFNVSAAERKCRGLRHLQPPGPVIVYQAKKDPVTGEWINEPDTFKRVEMPQQFKPKFNFDDSKK